MMERRRESRTKGRNIFKEEGIIVCFRCYSESSKIKTKNCPLDLVVGSSLITRESSFLGVLGTGAE